MMKGKKTQKTIRSYAPHLAVAAFVMVLVTVLALFAPAYAATSGPVNGLSDESIGLSYSGDEKVTWKADGTTVTGSAESTTGSDCSGSTTYTHAASILTITNKHTTKAKLSFSYTFNNIGSATVGGTTAMESGTYEGELDPNGSKQGAYTVKVSIESGDNDTATELKITGLSLEPIIDYYDVTVKVPDVAMGTAYVDEKKLEQDVVYSQRANNVPLALKAEAKAGYRFVGWFDEKTEFFFSYDAEYTYYPERNADILPYFVKDGDPMFSVNGVDYYEFRTAMLASASEGQPAVLTRDYTLPDGNYTIPAAATLLLPYEDGKTTINGQSDEWPFANRGESSSSANNDTLAVDYQLKKTLTIPSNAVIKNQGKIIVGGTVRGIGFAGSCGGPHCNIQLDGRIDMVGGSVLSVAGYVIGGGEVCTEQGGGARIYQMFTICDFRGGGYTVAAAGDSYALGSSINPSQEKFISPFTRYSARSIQTKITVKKGNTMFGYCDLYAGDKHNYTTSALLGDEGLITLTAADAEAVCSYDADSYVGDYAAIGRTTISLRGDAKLGFLTLTTMGKTIRTDQLAFPVPYNYDIHLAEGSYDVIYSMMLLPGARLYVGDGATLSVGNTSDGFKFLVLDGLRDHTSSSATSVIYGQRPGQNYPIPAALKSGTFGGTGTADLVVAGTLNVKSGVAFGGVVQADGDGTLVMDATATANCSTQIGLVGSKRIIISTYNFAGATTRTLNAQIIDTGTGQRLNILPGLIYHAGSGADILENYTYHLYTTSADTSKKETHTEDLNAAISGGWYSQMVTVHTVDSSGNELGIYQQGFAQGADISAFYTNKELTTKATTVTAATTDLYALAVASVDHEGTLTYYGLLGQAIKAAQQGDTVALLSNLTVDKPTAIAEDQSFKMDLAGNTLSGSSTLLVNNGTLTLDLNGGELSVVSTKPDNTALIGAIENAGTLSVVDSSTDQSGAIRCANSQEFTIKYASTTAIAQQGEANYDQSRTSTVSSRLDQLCGIVNNGTIKAISAGTVHGAYYGIYNTGTIETMGGSAVVTSDYTALQNNGTVKRISGGRLESTGKAFFIPTSWATCRGDVVKNSGMIGEITGNAEIGASAGSSMTFYSYQAAGKNYTHYLAPGAGLANDSGKTITMIGKSTISSESYYGIYNAGGTIKTIGEATIKSTSSYGLCNVNGGKITTIGAATISSDKYYALFNSGGTITTIDGTTITGAYGIWNRNIRKSSPTDGTQRTNSYSGTIGTIKDATVEAKWNYALRNVGTIQKISGTTVMRCTSAASDRYVVYNENGFYQDNSISKRTETTGKKYTRVDEYNAPYPTIGLITDYVQISSEKGRGIYSAGKITTINGSVTISAQNRALHVEGGGVIDTISGNAAISTTADYAVQVSGARTVKNEYEYAGKIDGNLINQVTTYGDPSRIGTITGNVEISAGTNYGIENRGTIDKISNGVTITAKNYAINNSASIPVSRKTTVATTEDVSAVANPEKGSTDPYDTKREYLYEYDKVSTIGTISNNVTITATGTTALRNYGKIDTLQNVTLNAASDVIYNHMDGTQTGSLARVWYAHGSSEYAVTTRYFVESDISGRQYAQSEINTIEDCTIKSTGGGAIAIKNGGKIITISGNKINAAGAAISNTTASRSAYMNTVKVTGEKKNWSKAADVANVTANGALPEIGTIDANTITSSSGNAIDNRGIINTMGAGGLSVTANAGHAVYSADSLKLDSYETASRTYAGQSCTVVTKITKNDGTITPAEIQTLTTGQYSASSGKYALYNNGSEAISVTAEALSPYRGPQFKSASSARAYAVYGLDNAAKQTYVSNGNQGTPVTLSAKADGDGWFYLVANTATVVFDPNGGAETSSFQTIDLSSASATITCPTFTKNQHEFLGFAVKADATKADFAVNESGALSIAVSALKEKTKAAAGDTITLYAVYKQSYLHTVDWIVTGVDGVEIEQTKIMTEDETVTKSVAYLKLTGKYIIKSCEISPKSGANQTVTLPADNINLTNITSDITVTLELVAYDHIVTVKDTNDKVLQTQYVSADGKDVLDSSKLVGYTAGEKQLIKEATGEKCTATISEDKTTVTITSINGDATVTVTLAAYDHIVTVTDGTASTKYYVKNNGNVLANNAPITYTATGKNVISGVTVSPNGKATASHTAATATITDITDSVTVTVALESYDHIVTVTDSGSSETHYVRDDKDVLTNAAITYTAGNKQVITNVTGHAATLTRGEGDVNAYVTDGWKSFTLSGIKEDQTVAVTLKDYAHTVDWTRKEDNKGSAITTTRREYVAANGSATLKLSEGFRATGVTGADSAAVTSIGTGVVTISGIAKDLTVTVTARNYSYAVTWNVNSTQEKTDYLDFDKTAATYTAGANTVITDASVSSGSAAQVTHTNTEVTVTGISSDVTVHVTTEAPTTDKATYYFGDMSYEYKRNTVLYQWDGKSEDKGRWIPVDSFAWQHKAGSRIYEFEGSPERYVVPNGSVLLVNGSNQTMQYTVTYAPDGELTNAVMTFTAGEETGSNTLSVVLKPGKQAMVSSTFACDVKDQKLTNAAAGQVTVTTAVYDG